MKRIGWSGQQRAWYPYGLCEFHSLGIHITRTLFYSLFASQWMLRVTGTGYGWRTIVLTKTSLIFKSWVRATQSQSDIWQGQVSITRASRAQSGIRKITHTRALRAQSRRSGKARVENGLRHGPNRYMRQESKKVRAQIIHMRLGYEGHSGVRKNDRT